MRVSMKRGLKKHDRRVDRKLYGWLVLCMVLSILQYVFRLPIIGAGHTYHLIVDLLPILVGMVVFALSRRKYLWRRMATTEGLGWKAILSVFFVVQGILVAYLSFGLVARTIADQVNKAYAADQPARTERLPITWVWMKRKRNYVEVERNGSEERIYTGYIKALDMPRGPIPYDLVLVTREGILGTAVIEDYALESQ